MSKKRKPKTLRQKLVKAADDAMSKYVRARDKRCVICGSTQNLQAGHLITRSKYSTRWDIENVFTQCSGCNLRHEYSPEIFTSWYIEKFGVKKYQLLVKRSNTVVKYTNDDLKLIAEYFKKKWEALI